MQTRSDPQIYTYFTVYTRAVSFLILLVKVVIHSTVVCLGAFLLSYTADTIKAGEAFNTFVAGTHWSTQSLTNASHILNAQ